MALPTTGVMNALGAAARAPLSRSGSSRLCGNASTHRSLKAAALVSGRRQTVAASALFGLSSAKASEVALPGTSTRFFLPTSPPRPSCPVCLVWSGQFTKASSEADPNHRASPAETTAVMSATDGAAHQANAANVQTASLSRVIVSVGSGAAGRPVAGMLNGPTSVVSTHEHYLLGHTMPHATSCMNPHPTGQVRH